MNDSIGRADPPAFGRQYGVDLHITVSEQPDAATLRSWDWLVATTAGSDVTQLSAWAGVRRWAGFTPIFVLASSADRVVGGALVLRRRLPGLGAVGHVPYGPVLSVDGPLGATEAALCRALTHLTSRRLWALFVQPPRGGEFVSRRLLRLGFRPSDAGIAPTASLEIDLSAPPEILAMSLSSGTLGSIRRAASRDVRVRMADERDLPVVADLLAETATHHGFPPLPLAYLHTLYQQLDLGNHIKVFIAALNGVPVATQVLTSCGGVAKLRLAGMRRTGGAARSGAPAMLQWATILKARANGYHTFDFGGISPSAVDAIRAGSADLASRLNGRDYFKASFGGRPFRYPPPVELFSSTATRLGYELARRSELGRHMIRRAHNLLHDGGATR